MSESVCVCVCVCVCVFVCTHWPAQRVWVRAWPSALPWGQLGRQRNKGNKMILLPLLIRPPKAGFPDALKFTVPQHQPFRIPRSHWEARSKPLQVQLPFYASALLHLTSWKWGSNRREQTTPELLPSKAQAFPGAVGADT